MDRSFAAALTPSLLLLRDHTSRILHAALQAVDPAKLVREAVARNAIEIPSTDPLTLVAAGKAAHPMARALALLMGDRIRHALVAGPVEASATLPSGWEVLQPAHPFPDDISVLAGNRALALARHSTPGSLIVLLSGGASSMLCAPAQGLPLEHKISTTRALMNAGIPIAGLNCVRKHLSTLKGGRLGAAASQSVTLAISDVHDPVEDDPAVIGSGPTVADPTTFAEALQVVQGVTGIPNEVRQHLQRGVRGEIEETIKPGDARLADARFFVIGNRMTALAGAARCATGLGYTAVVFEEPVRGEARVAARDFVARARAIAAQYSNPVCILGGGETTVHVSGTGRGGRNQEFALAAARDISGTSTRLQERGASTERVTLLASFGTDGIDGRTTAAGAIVDATTLDRARRANVDWELALMNNDAWHFFNALGDLVITGPTGTNVGDLQIMLVA